MTLHDMMTIAWLTTVPLQALSDQDELNINNQILKTDFFFNCDFFIKVTSLYGGWLEMTGAVPLTIFLRSISDKKCCQF